MGNTVGMCVLCSLGGCSTVWAPSVAWSGELGPGVREGGESGDVACSHGAFSGEALSRVRNARNAITATLSLLREPTGWA